MTALLRPVPYALDDVDPHERFITSTGAQFAQLTIVQTRQGRRKPVDYKSRPLPYALDDGADAPSHYSTSSGDAFIARDLKAARPARLAKSDYHGRPLPYARDDGVDEGSPALKPPRKKENRFTQGRPVPFALDSLPVGVDRYSTSSGEQYIARDLKEARPAARVTHDQLYNIVTLTDIPVHKDLKWRWNND